MRYKEQKSPTMHCPVVTHLEVVGIPVSVNVSFMVMR